MKLRLFGKRHDAVENAYTHYIALGDSISTDDYPGKDRGGASLFYKNDDSVYPEFRERDLRSLFPKLHFHLIAQDGATTTDVLQDQLPRLIQIDPKFPLISLTAGGNDILSMQAESDEIRGRISRIVQEIISHFPNAKILLGTIYDPTDAVGDLMGPGTSLDREMQILHVVNAHIRGISEQAGFALADIYQHFLGHGSHYNDPTNPYFQPEDLSLWYTQTIEPNERGGHELRKLFWQAFSKLTEAKP